jgi:dUTP pyrophosphatase
MTADDPLHKLDRFLSGLPPTADESKQAVWTLRDATLSPPPIDVEKLYEDAKLPQPQETGDAGADLYSYVDGEEIAIGPGERTLVSTGLRMKLPPRTELQIRPRSGLALDWGVTVLNAPGTVDEGYRGEVGVVLINHGDTSVLVKHHDRIAQAVLKPALKMEFGEVKSVDTDTARGEGGFGSTGTK